MEWATTCGDAASGTGSPPTPSSGSRPSRPAFTPGIRILYYGRGFEAGLSGSTCYLSGSYSRYLGLVNVPFHSDLNTPSLPRSSYDIYSAVDWGKRICMYGQVPGSSLGYFSEWNFNLALCLFHIIFLFLSVLGDRSNVLFFFFPVWTQLARHSWETYLMFPDNEHLY